MIWLTWHSVHSGVKILSANGMVRIQHWDSSNHHADINRSAPIRGNQRNDVVAVQSLYNSVPISAPFYPNNGKVFGQKAEGIQDDCIQSTTWFSSNPSRIKAGNIMNDLT